MIVSQIWKGGASLLNWLNPQQKALQEANDQALNKQNKIHTFDSMTAANDYRMLASKDRDIVEDFERRNMNASSKKKPENQDAWVCDNMTIDNSKGNGILEILLIAILCFFGFKYLNPPQQPVPSPCEDSEYQVQFYDKDMNPIQVPRVPKKGE